MSPPTSAMRTRRPPRALGWADAMFGRALDRGKGPTSLRLLTVPGRRTGRPRTTPIAPVFGDDGAVWLVAAYGDPAWVRNVRAAGEVELHRGDDHVRYDARELDPVEAVPVLRAYLGRATSLFVRRHFAVSARSSDNAIAGDVARHPTFALTPAFSREAQQRRHRRGDHIAAAVLEADGKVSFIPADRAEEQPPGRDR